MSRRSNFLPFLFAAATSAVTVAAAIQYRRQKAAAVRRWLDRGTVAKTALGPVEYAEAGAGEPALVIHGAPGGFMEGLVAGEPLVEAGHRVIAPSRFGYGRSPMPADASPAAQGDHLAALLDTLKIDQAVVMGVSAGGPAAVELAARHPDRVRALIMMAAVSQARNVYAEERTPPLAMLEFGLRGDVAMWLALHFAIRSIPFAAAERPTLQSLLDRPSLMAMYQRLLWAMWPISLQKAGVDNDAAQIKRLKLPLKKVTVPTLVLHGTDDLLVPYETGVHTASQIPGAKLLRFERGEHGLFVTQFDEVWLPVLDFIKPAKKPAAKGKAAEKKPARKPAASKAKKPAAAKRPAPRRPPARKAS